VLQVVGDEAGPGQDENHDDHEQQEIAGEVDLEIGRIDAQELGPPRAMNLKSSIFSEI